MPCMVICLPFYTYLKVYCIHGCVLVIVSFVLSRCIHIWIMSGLSIYHRCCLWIMVRIHISWFIIIIFLSFFLSFFFFFFLFFFFFFFFFFVKSDCSNAKDRIRVASPYSIFRIRTNRMTYFYIQTMAKETEIIRGRKKQKKKLPFARHYCSEV